MVNPGDTNEKYIYIFFFEKLKQRHHYNMISSFEMENRKWTQDYTKITEHFIKFYENFLSSAAITHDDIDDQIIAMGPCLSISQQLSLVKPFTKEDVNKALFSIPTHKSPSPDGYNNGFFK